MAERSVNFVKQDKKWIFVVIPNKWSDRSIHEVARDGGAPQPPPFDQLIMAKFWTGQEQWYVTNITYKLATNLGNCMESMSLAASGLIDPVLVEH